MPSLLRPTVVCGAVTLFAAVVALRFGVIKHERSIWQKMQHVSRLLKGLPSPLPTPRHLYEILVLLRGQTEKCFGAVIHSDSLLKVGQCDSCLQFNDTAV
jgi:hypothetical protein